MAVPSFKCVCLPVQGAYLKSVGVSPNEAIIQAENWGASWASPLGAQGICNMRKLQGRSPRAVGLGSWAGKNPKSSSQPSATPHSVRRSSLTSKYRKDPPLLCESSMRNSILFQEVFWGVIMDSAGILRNVPRRRQLSAEGMVHASARLEHGRLTGPGCLVGSPFLICFLLRF